MKKVLALVLEASFKLAAYSTGLSKEAECPEWLDTSFRPELHGKSLVEATQIVVQDGGEICVGSNDDWPLIPTLRCRERR